MYLYIYMYIYIYIHICICICMYIYICLHIDIYVRTYNRATPVARFAVVGRLARWLFIHTHIYIYIYIYIHRYVHIYTYNRATLVAPLTGVGRLARWLLRARHADIWSGRRRARLARPRAGRARPPLVRRQWRALGESRPGTKISSREWPARRPLRAVWVGPETYQDPAVPHEDSYFVKYRSEPLTDCTIPLTDCTILALR